MNNSYFPGTIVIADTETTGAKVDTDGVCQLAAVIMSQQPDMSWSINPLFQTYCSPSAPMAPEAQAVHGITPEMYKYAPTDAMAMWFLSAAINSLPAPVILSGYNCTRFDYPIMNRLSNQSFARYPQLDVMTLMLREQPEKGLKLTEVFAEQVNDQDLLNSAHDAMADCWMTARVLANYLAKYQTDPITLSQWVNTPTQIEVMPWGKYKGKPFNEVPKTYLQWMAAKWTDMHPDLSLSLRNKGLL